MGKPKMWNISKTENPSAKGTKIWYPGSYSAHIRILFMPD